MPHTRSHQGRVLRRQLQPSEPHGVRSNLVPGNVLQEDLGNLARGQGLYEVQALATREGLWQNRWQQAPHCFFNATHPSCLPV